MNRGAPQTESICGTLAGHDRLLVGLHRCSLLLTLCDTLRAPDVALADLHKPAADGHRRQRASHHAGAGQAIEHHAGAAQLCQLGSKLGVTRAQHVLHPQAVQQRTLGRAASSCHWRGTCCSDDLHGRQADATCCRMHQHAVCRAGCCQLVERGVDGDEDGGHGGSRLKGEVGGHHGNRLSRGMDVAAQAASCQAKHSIARLQA